MAMVHPTDAVPVVQDAGEQEWLPSLGALPVLANPYFGPSSGLIVSLATGNLTYLPKSDFFGHNNFGADAVFSRAYRSELARRGIGSPGLPAGWVHTWDVTLAADGEGSNMALVYPNGVRETVTPEVGQDGRPTGKFVQPSGRPFLVSGVPSAMAPGSWDQLTVTWRSGSWIFAPGADRKTYVLRQIGDLLLDWDETRRIRTVRSAHEPKTYLLAFEYRPGDGLLTGVIDVEKRRMDYRYETPPPNAGMGTAPALMGIVTPHLTGEPASKNFRQAYGYTASGGKALMDKVSVPINGAYSTALVMYRDQSVAMMVDGNENRRVYTYLPTGTRVEVWGKTDTRPLTFWTDNIDSLSRHTGTTDAAGHSTKVDYGK